MRIHPIRRVVILAALLGMLPVLAAAQNAKSYQPTEQELAELQAQAAALGQQIAALKANPPAEIPHIDDALADVAVFHKGAEWIVRHKEFYTKDYVLWALQALQQGAERAEQLLAEKTPWNRATGSIVRGYVSKVDGSVQPYAVIVPDRPVPPDYRYRLDVILHGRNATLNEVRFIHDHSGKNVSTDSPGLVLHVFGRTNNAFRWAGETDVFEAIDAVKRHYPVDVRRIVLRGFSMGGAGAWHLGLQHPDVWCAVEAGAGFTETKNYANLKDLPEYQEKALHIYDALDYALNAFDLPMAGYGGELDKQLQASVNIKEALEGLGVTMTTEGLVTRAEGIDFLNVVGAKMGHKVDPASAEILKEFRDEHAAEGIDPIHPVSIRFITYTLKFNRAPWLTVERMMEHYKPATVEAEVDGDRVRIQTENVRALGVQRNAGETIVLGDQVFPLRQAVEGLLPEVYFRKLEAGWEMLDYDQSRALQRNVKREKAPGLQGPIDDAFTGPFLCVRATNRPWNPQVQRWADARLQRFADNWSKYLRGDLRIKDDVDVTAEDVENFHLILFGDPGSNLWIERLLDKLPIHWTRNEVRLGGTYPAADHAPLLIAPNPLNQNRYVVINSGHTFGAKQFEGTNALLFPHLGDYAVIQVGGLDEEVKISGYFDESWSLPPTDAQETGDGRE